MTKQEYFKLLDKYEAGTATPKEERLLYAYYNLFDLRPDGLQDLTEQELARLSAAIKEKIDQKTVFETTQQNRIKLWPRVAGIAAAVIGIAVCIYLYHPTDTPLSSRVSRDLNDIAPGGNHATLTINGEVIPLSDAKSGIVMSDKRLAYNDGTSLERHSDPLSSRGYEGSQTDKPIKNITAETPKGGMYQITLPDNTKVWLNNDSKLEFASNFGKTNQRIVDLDGEAYFEVVKNAAMPFKVRSNGQEVTVLGTHFNVSAYKGEGIKTTLLEGSVRVAPTPSSGASTLSSRAPTLSSRGKRSDEGPITLKPNQQSLVAANQGITVKQVDANAAIDWKNGQFIFNDEPLESIMRKVARWYNVEVIYKDADPKALFYGSISRYSQVSKILSKLEVTGGIHFKVEGRKIYISK